MVYFQIDFKKEATNPDKMEIKDELVLHRITWSAANKIEYNTIGAFQTSDSNTPVYYILWWTVNAYTLQKKYTCYAFHPPVLIHEGELVCPANFMTPTRKTSYWYHYTYEAIPIMVKLKQVLMPYIAFIQDPR